MNIEEKIATLEEKIMMLERELEHVRLEIDCNFQINTVNSQMMFKLFKQKYEGIKDKAEVQGF